MGHEEIPSTGYCAAPIFYRSPTKIRPGWLPLFPLHN
jgi:hypothetical protein